MAKRKNQTFVNFARTLLLSILIGYLTTSVYAHEEVVHETATDSFFHSINTNLVLLLSGIVILSFVIMSLRYTKMNQDEKKIFFVIIAIAALLSTGYLIANTVYMTFTSWSKGLVHWHADFEIWICGERLDMENPTGLANRIGTTTTHHHGDDRIHIEGVIMERQDATIGNFITEISTPELQERFSVLEFQNCPNHHATKESMYVNDVLYQGNIADYVISPYSNVPPGDVIKIVFE